MGSDTIAMAETVYVGLAVTSHSVSAATTAVIDGLRITVSAESSANMPPAVVLSSPANGTTYTAPVTVTLTASATDPDGTIAAVEFYVNGTLFGRDTAAPYTMTGSPAAGSYSITAVATDTKGASATSSTVTVTVKAGAVPVGAPRLVAFTASATHALVVRYVLEVYGAGATPGVSSPVATSDLGKPAPASNGDISVDRATFFAALPAGNYVAAVVAVGSSATARSASITFTR
jgi:hypothetical protein